MSIRPKQNLRTIYPFRHFHLLCIVFSFAGFRTPSKQYGHESHCSCFSITITYSFVGAEMSVILRSLLLSELACFMYLTVIWLISERYSENSSSVSSSVQFVSSSISFCGSALPVENILQTKHKCSTATSVPHFRFYLPLPLPVYACRYTLQSNHL